MARRELFIWADVDSALRESMEAGVWPDWLTSASAYSFGLSVEAKDSVRRDVVFDWLTNALGAKITRRPDGDVGVELTSGKWLPIDIDFVDDIKNTQLRFLFDQSSNIRRPAKINLATGSVNDPVVYAFHSFKGGVGRTTSAIALATAIASEIGDGKVLLVDADLEAPGISFLIEERWPNYPASFSDLLALANDGHDYAAACHVIAKRIDSFKVDGVRFLPAYRGGCGFDGIGVRPEHLIKNSADPFVLSNLLKELGKALAVDAVVIDLRAGVSEISAGLALDPTVKRVLVSTLSGQSFLGTRRLLERVGRWDRMVGSLSGSDEGFESPHLVISQVREESVALAEEIYVAEAIRAYMGKDSSPQDGDRFEPTITTSIIPHHGELESLSPTWDKASAAIRRSEIASSLGVLVGAVVARRAEQAAEKTDHDHAPQVTADDRNSQRIAIERFSDSLEFAESGTGQGFLVTDAIRNLVSDFGDALPSVPVIGKKGAGKSYMFLQLVRSRTWQKFCLRAGLDGAASDADIFPVLAPINLSIEAEQLVEDARNGAAEALGLSALPLTACRDRLRQAQVHGEDEVAWRGFWMGLLCNSVGFSSFTELSEHLQVKGRKILFLVDGLEDVLQSLHESRAQQAAIRALATEVMGLVERSGGHKVGFLCFVRHDMVGSSVRQNFGQFFQRYKRYALRWGRVDALRLVGWVADQSGAIPISSPDEVDEAKMSQLLIPLWGQKLGSPNANEAYSSEWVLAALSDFRGQVQARDVVRFLKISAHGSTGASAWTDRVLTPPAIRNAPEICGQKKIQDVEQESPQLKGIFNKLREATADRRVIPFSPIEFNLTIGELDLLEREGVVLREPDGYYMPEMYRQGLRFSLPRGARPRVLALARRAKVGAAPFL